jgi:xanthine dehydrogenase accessory factor
MTERRDEAFDALREWAAAGSRLAIATLVEAVGSAPRPIGSRLVVADDSRLAGSVSGGCVEGAIIEQALEAMRTGRSRLLHYGISDEAAWDVGLTCGGEIDVFLEPLDPERRRLYVAVAEAVAAQRPVATAAVIRGPEERLGTHLAVYPDGEDGTWPLDDRDSLVDSLRRSLGELRSSATVAAEPSGVEVFTNVIAPPPRVWIVGADNVSVYLARVVADAGFLPIVIDPRATFADPARFPGAELRNAWPDEVLGKADLGPRDYVVVVSNDPKIDEPALRAALAAAPAYIGAIGSRHKQEERRERLVADGVSPERLRALHAPIGLDLGGNEPAELALSIAAELVAARRGGSGHPMREVRPIMRGSGPGRPL